MSDRLVRHSEACRMAYGRPRPDTGCPRCVELASGAAPRTWHGRGRSSGYPSRDELRRHDCRQAGCAVVCTFGEW